MRFAYSFAALLCVILVITHQMQPSSAIKKKKLIKKLKEALPFLMAMKSKKKLVFLPLPLPIPLPIPKFLPIPLGLGGIGHGIGAGIASSIGEKFGHSSSHSSQSVSAPVTTSWVSAPVQSYVSAPAPVSWPSSGNCGDSGCGGGQSHAVSVSSGCSSGGCGQSWPSISNSDYSAMLMDCGEANHQHSRPVSQPIVVHSTSSGHDQQSSGPIYINYAGSNGYSSGGHETITSAGGYYPSGGQISSGGCNGGSCSKSYVDSGYGGNNGQHAGQVSSGGYKA